MPRRKRRSSSVPPGNIYLTIHLNPPTTDDLVLMKSIHDAMQQTFGLTRALTHFDVAWKDTEGTRIVIRVGKEDCGAFKGALTAWSGSTRFSVVTENEALDQ